MLAVIYVLLQPLLGFLLWQIVRILRLALDKDLSKIPGPWIGRFTNLVLKWHTLNGTRNTYIDGLHKQYGSVVRIAPNELDICDVDAVHEIHRVGTFFRKGPWYHKLSPKQADDDNGGLFTIRDPKKASARRKLFLHAGTKSMIHDWEVEVSNVVNLTVSKMKRDLNDCGRVDVMKWWEFMTADVMGLVAFGESFHMVETEKKAALLDDVAAIFHFMEWQVEAPWFVTVMNFLRVSLVKSGPGMQARSIEYSKKAIMSTREAAKTSTKTLFSKMVDPDEQPVPDQVVSSEAINLLSAGADTTMLALTYLVYAVLSDETGEIKRRLIEEIMMHSENPTWAELDSMPFLNNVIKETLRLYAPIAGTLPRSTPEDGVLLLGYTIPGGTIVGTQALSLHTDPSVWRNPMKFDPDRWYSPTPEMKQCFMAFGGSARYCVGQNIAQLELMRATTEFFRRCPDVKLASETTWDSMRSIELFTGKPRAGKCEIVVA